MFTGIVTDVGEIAAVKVRAPGLHRLSILCDYPAGSIANGASIACAGVCLTVVAKGEQEGRTWFDVDTAAETLRLTTVGTWREGTKVNLERPLKLGDELGGHIVAGHVDGIAVVTMRENLPQSSRLTLRVPRELARFIAPKGSVALDGVSLTINDVDGETFSAVIIPHTLKVTTLGQLETGSAANIEVDLMARYAARLMQIS